MSKVPCIDFGTDDRTTVATIEVDAEALAQALDRILAAPAIQATERPLSQRVQNWAEHFTNGPTFPHQFRRRRPPWSPHS